MKKEVALEEVVGVTLDTMRKVGLLLVSVDKEGKPNAMTIGWGFIGILWAEPSFVIAVRPSRYTYKLLEESNDFTVNVPAKGMEDVVSYCGTVSGRYTDKFKDCNLTSLKSKYVKSPIIKECIIHYECIVRYKYDLEPSKVPRDITSLWYPTNDFHRIYIGRIEAVYADEDYKSKTY